MAALVDDGGMTSQPAPRSPYAMGSWPNMLRSLLVIGIIVAGVIAIVPRVSKVERPAVDARGKAQQVAQQTGWKVELPSGLGGDYLPTVATLAPGAENINTFVTVWSSATRGDIALKQAGGATPGWVTKAVNGGRRTGSVTVGGRAWDRYAVAGRDQLSYVRPAVGAGDVTVVVTGDVPDADLKAFAASLKQVAAS